MDIANFVNLRADDAVEAERARIDIRESDGAGSYEAHCSEHGWEASSDKRTVEAACDAHIREKHDVGRLAEGARALVHQWWNTLVNLHDPRQSNLHSSLKSAEIVLGLALWAIAERFDDHPDYDSAWEPSEQGATLSGSGG